MKYIKNFFENILIYTKRILGHPGIVLLLFCMPLLALVFNTYINKAEGAFVGIYAEGNADEVIADLVKNTDAITFRVYTDKEQMKLDVETQLLECAFILPENVADIENMQIINGEGYAAVLTEVSKEAVFASVLKIYGDKAALSFAKKSNIGIVDDNFESSYLKYVESTPSSVTFEEAPARPETSTPKRNIPLCVCAMLLICAGLIGTTFAIKDKKIGINFGAGSCIAVSVVLFLISALVSLYILDKKPDHIRFLIFCAGIWGGSMIFAGFVKNEKIAWIIMPLVIMTVFLFDIVRISNISPAFLPIEKMILYPYFIYEKTLNLTGFSGVLCILGTLKQKYR